MELMAALLAILCAARLTRLLAFDSWSPTAWLRARWDAMTEGSTWNILLHCPYCLAPWMLLAVMAGGLTFGQIGLPGDGFWQDFWWFGAYWLGGSYIASMVVIYDGDD